MCLIAYQPAGDEPFSADILANGWDANHDGAGYMFAVDGKLIVRKPFFKLAELREAYQADHAAHGGMSAFVLHFRWSTHGKKDETNTHPHILAGGRAALVHNGILGDFAPDWKSDVSDTVIFCRTVLAYRQPSQLTGRKFGRYLAGMIGERNKLALMDYRGNVSIVNAGSGVWDGSRWYSNGDYLARVAVLPPSQFVSLYSGASNLPVQYQRDLWEYPPGDGGGASDRPDEWDAKAEAAEDERFNDIMDELIDAALAKTEDAGNINWDDIEVEAARILAVELASAD